MGLPDRKSPEPMQHCVGHEADRPAGIRPTQSTQSYAIRLREGAEARGNWGDSSALRPAPGGPDVPIASDDAQYLGASPACLQSSFAVIRSNCRCRLIGMALLPSVYME